MLQLGLIDVVQAEREREIEAAIRIRRLLKPQEETEAPQAPVRAEARSVSIRPRPTEG